MKQQRKPGALNRLQVRFVELYLRYGDGPKAYREAYSNKASKDHVIDVKVRNLLLHPDIKGIIDAARAQSRFQLNVAATVASNAIPPAPAEIINTSRDAIVRSLSRLAFSDLRDYLSWGPRGAKIKDSSKLTEAQSYAVVEITQVGKDGSVKIKLADKSKALMDLARIQGFLDTDAWQQSNSQAPDDERRKRVRQQIMDALAALARPEPLTIEASGVAYRPNGRAGDAGDRGASG